MRLYAIIGGLGLLLAAFAGTGYFAFNYGKDSLRASLAAQIESYRDNQRLLVDKLEAANAKERIVVKEKIRIVRQAVDECSSRTINPAILNQLR